MLFYLQERALSHSYLILYHHFRNEEIRSVKSSDHRQTVAGLLLIFGQWPVRPELLLLLNVIGRKIEGTKKISGELFLVLMDGLEAPGISIRTQVSIYHNQRTQHKGGTFYSNYPQLTQIL